MSSDEQDSSDNFWSAGIKICNTEENRTCATFFRCDYTSGQCDLQPWAVLALFLLIIVIVLALFKLIAIIRTFCASEPDAVKSRTPVKKLGDMNNEGYLRFV